MELSSLSGSPKQNGWPTWPEVSALLTQSKPKEVFMPTPNQIGQKLAQQGKPLPPMNNTPSPIREQVKTGYGSVKK
jgi:hypothetical protein